MYRFVASGRNEPTQVGAFQASNSPHCTNGDGLPDDEVIDNTNVDE